MNKKSKTDIGTMERYRLLVERAKEYAIFALDLQGRVVTWNAGAERILGYNKSEIIGENFARFFTPDDIRAGAPERELQEAYKRGKADDERWHVRKNGSCFWASGVLLPLRDKDGKTRGYSKLLRDMTERKLDEEKLRQIEERYRLLIEDAKEYAFFMLDNDCRIVAWNKGGERILGYKSDEIIGRHLFDLFTPEDVTSGEAQGEVDTATADGMAEDERWHLRKDGQRFWASGVLRALRDKSGALKGYSKIMRDLTERKRAEEGLRESEQRYRLLIEEVRDFGIFMLDPQGKILTWNSGAARFKHYKSNEIIGQHFSIFFTEEDQKAGRPEYELKKAAADGHYRNEGWRVAKGGEKFWAEEIVNAIRDKSGALVGFSKIIRDISERRHAEEERAHLLAQEHAARLEAEQASRLKDDFVTTVSHELRTPLQAILGWSKLLLGRKLDPSKSEQGLAVIERNARLQAQLVDDLLDISRMLSGRLRLAVRPVDLSEIIREAVESIRPASDAKGIDVTISADAEGIVRGDPDRLRQIVWNLLSNAVKFTPNGGHVDVRMDRADNRFNIIVSDTGKGITPEFLPHVFERFRQANSSITRSFGGLGLGLAIVRQLTELHGGTVSAESAGEDKGSKFTVSLPVMPPAEAMKGSAVRPATKARSGQSGASHLDSLRILVVDDEPDARELLTELFEENRAEVIVAASAKDALAAFARTRPDVLVCDIGMPEEDGYSLIRKIRALPAEQGGTIHALALTAYAREEDRYMALEAGFEAHVAKPIEPDELVRTVAELAGRAVVQ
jgi:PAS domain S-box-containing protein